MADERRLERIEKKLDMQYEHLGSIDNTLQLQHLSLVTHIKRTEMLEEEVAPIKKWMYMTQGAAALLTLLAIVASIYAVFK